MFNNKKVNIIISLLIAIGLWAFVVGELNPETKDEKRNIPITFVNEEVLAEKGLSVLSLSEDTIDVEVSGQRSVIAKLNAEKIEATVDLALANEGSNALKVKIKVPEKVEIEDSSVRIITVVVEKTITDLKNIEVIYEGNENVDAEPTLVDISKKKIAVSGANTLVNRVAFLKAIVPSDKVKEEMKTISVNLIPVDEHGDPVENVMLSSDRVNITSVLKKTKTVKLALNLNGYDPSNDSMTVSSPKVITIKGTEKDLKNIETIQTEKIDLSNIIEDTQLLIEPILPEGVELADTSKKNLLSVVVINNVSKKIAIDKNDVKIDNLNGDFIAEILTDPIVVTLVGREDVLANITKNELKVTLNLKKLRVGEHEVLLNVTCSEPTKVVEELSVVVKISQSENENDN